MVKVRVRGQGLGIMHYGNVVLSFPRLSNLPPCFLPPPLFTDVHSLLSLSFSYLVLMQILFKKKKNSTRSTSGSSPALNLAKCFTPSLLYRTGSHCYFRLFFLMCFKCIKCKRVCIFFFFFFICPSLNHAAASLTVCLHLQLSRFSSVT